MVSSSRSDKAIRALLGLGFFVQGLRCFPWMAVNFLLKDELNVDPSTLQLLQNSANLPMVGKPLYGIISDAVYLSGQHRVPYIAIGALLQAVSWAALALCTRSGIPTFAVFLLLSNLGASISEVANDAIVAELGKSSNPKDTKSPASHGLQAFVSMASSAGGILAFSLTGIAITYLSPHTMFLFFTLILTLQFIISVSFHESSLGLPKSAASNGLQKQLADLTLSLKSPEILCSVAWLAMSYAIVPALTGNMFYYQTQVLDINPAVLGVSKVFGQVAMLLWSAMYHRSLSSIPERKLIATTQAAMAVLTVSDMLFIKGIYREMGVSDSLYVLLFSGLLEVLCFFKILPFSVLMARLCPPGCEGSVMAVVASAVALSLILSGYLGVALASLLGVTGSDFSRFPLAILVQAACTILPVFWSSLISNGRKPKAS